MEGAGVRAAAVDDRGLVEVIGLVDHSAAVRIRQGGRRVREVGEGLAHGDEVERLRPEDEVLCRHADELQVLVCVPARDRQHVGGQVDAEDDAWFHPRRHQVGDESRAGADVEDMFVLRRGGQVDQPRGHPTVLAAGPVVVDGCEPVEEVDDVVDDLARRVGAHQCHRWLLNLGGRFRARLLRC